jgi:hypothetical protein
VAPFALVVSALHLWGAGLNQAFARLLAGRKYEGRLSAPYHIFARRGSDLHGQAAQTLEEFTRSVAQNARSFFRFRVPDGRALTLTVRLLESHEDLKREGLSDLFPDLANNGGYFNHVTRKIALVLGTPGKWTEIDRKGLRHEMTHALMHLSAPDADWSPWLAEGLAGYFENGSLPRFGGATTEQVEEIRADLRLDRLPPLDRLLGAGSQAFRDADNRRAYRQSQFLVAFLLESPLYLHRFSEYYEEEFKPGPATIDAFEALVGEFEVVERDWREWFSRLD